MKDTQNKGTLLGRPLTVFVLPFVALLGLGTAARVEAARTGHGPASIARSLAASTPLAIAARASDRRVGRAREGRRVVRHRIVRPVYGSIGWYSGWPYGYYGAYGYYGPGALVGFAPADAGALDINTRPKKASVYIDGELVGRADSFDGFPRYLWLREGSYRLALHMEGYRTLEREVRVQPGVVIKINDDLAPGASVLPGSASSAGSAPPPAVTRPPVAPTPAEPEAAPAESWRVENRGRPIGRDLRREPARLILAIEPADAVAYLDGRLLGSGAELARLHAPLIIDPGSHRLEVARPGHASEVRSFDAERGQDVTLRVVLQPD